MDDAHAPTATLVFAPLRLRLHPGGHAIELTAPDVVLGRHSTADLRMPLPDVSRRHCRFRNTGAGWELIDLDSLNGVYVNGARVTQVPLNPGDQIRICGLELEVEAAQGGAKTEVLRQIAGALPAEVPHRKAS